MSEYKIIKIENIRIPFGTEIDSFGTTKLLITSISGDVLNHLREYETVLWNKYRGKGYLHPVFVDRPKFKLMLDCRFDSSLIVNHNGEIITASEIPRGVTGNIKLRCKEWNFNRKFGVTFTIDELVLFEKHKKREKHENRERKSKISVELSNNTDHDTQECDNVVRDTTQKNKKSKRIKKPIFSFSDASDS